MAKSNTTSAAAAEPSGLATGIQVSGGSRGTSDIATEPLHVTLERSSLPGGGAALAHAIIPAFP